MAWERQLDEAQEWLRSWTAQISQRAEAATALSDRVAALESTAEDLDGAVRVRVDGAGRLVGLELGERARDLSAAGLAEVIMGTVARAQHGLNARVAEAVAETVGADTETGRAVLNSFAHRYPDPDQSDERR
ncbi:MAG TPA: YbaB/EbfC family nucleoid-associated protein [Natronosporangium sp.]|nr:YbaB/EbfC family nucleoid-associated protein [Natronosporangium sp.]